MVPATLNAAAAMVNRIFTRPPKVANCLPAGRRRDSPMRPAGGASSLLPGPLPRPPAPSQDWPVPRGDSPGLGGNFGVQETAAQPAGSGLTCSAPGCTSPADDILGSQYSDGRAIDELADWLAKQLLRAHPGARPADPRGHREHGPRRPRAAPQVALMSNSSGESGRDVVRRLETTAQRQARRW